jgi:uncharacterized membrane-anchored protein
MLNRKLVAIVLSLTFLVPLGFAAKKEIQWQSGPSTANLEDIAEINLIKGYLATNSEGTRLAMEECQNPITGQEVGMVITENESWFVVFEFDPVGYIKDDEKDSLDADALLKSIRAGNDAGNEERKKRGWSTMTILGWEQKPKYNSTTHNLEWAIKVQDDKSKTVSINYNTRLLGRKGVMQVSLVVDPQEYGKALPKFQDLLTKFKYKKGNKYSEYVKGDKLAKYGLAALIAGGATAVAAKTGLLRYLWKIIVVAGVAVAGFFKKIFGRNK